jgi:hypothetical protein
MSGPPITITCDCGERRAVAYGERWRCEHCGRSWNTRQIPVEEYESLLRRMRRHKLEAVGAGAVVAVVLISLIVYSQRFMLLVPAVMSVWLFVFLPYWRRRYRRTASGSPQWQLHPE